MKTKKKVVLALLSLSCVAAGAFGLAACGGGDDRDASIVNVYNQYVAYAESNGETPMTYEVWLNSIKGQKGDQGAPGEAGKSAYELYRENFLKNNPNGTPMSESAWIASLTGKNGKGVEKIELNANQTKLVVTYTDGSSEEVDLPEALVHVHEYDSNYVTVLAPTETADGLGYLTCQTEGCGHNELLVIKPYEVTVLLADGKTPAADASVTLNGVTVKTNASGVAKFKDLKLGEYDLSVTKSGYTFLDSIKTSISIHEYKVILAEELNPDADFGNDITPGSEVGDKKLFHLSAEYTEDGFGGWTLCDVYLEGASNGYSKFKLTFNEEYGDFVYWEGSTQNFRGDIEDDGVVEFVVAPGETVSLQMTVNMGLQEKVYDYAFTVERATPPKDGEKDAPIAVSLEEEISCTAQANEEVYFKVSTENGKLYGFELGEGVTLIALGGNKNSDGTLITSEDLTVESKTYVYYLKAKSADGNISFKMKRVYREGEQGNPSTLTLGTVQYAKVNFSQRIYNVWFKYTVTAEKAYTLDVLSGYYDFDVYKGDNPFDAKLVQSGINSKMYISTLTEGTYYFVMNTECTFVLKEYDAATDGGYSKEYPKEITDGTLELTGTSDMYFKYIVPKSGMFAMTALKVDDSYVSSFTVYSDSDFSTKLFGHFDTNKNVEVTEGQVLYFTARAGYVGDTHTITFGTYDVSEEVENVLIVKDDDGNVLNGITVTVYETNESGAQVEKCTAVTDTDGKVSFNLIAGDKYTVTLDFGENASDYMAFANVKLEKTYVACELNLTVKKLREFTFNVKLGAAAAGAGITVSYNGYSAQSDESGAVTLKMPNPARYQDYSVSVSNIPEGYEFATRTYLREGVYVYDLVLTTKPVTITLTGATTTVEVKAGVVYSFVNKAVDMTISVTNGHLVTLNSNNGFNINGLDVKFGSLENSSDDGVGYTMIEYYPYGTETLTVVFSEDATLTISY